MQMKVATGYAMMRKISFIKIARLDSKISYSVLNPWGDSKNEKICKNVICGVDSDMLRLFGECGY